MGDRFAIARGFEVLGALYAEHTSLPLATGLRISLHLFGSRALPRAEQVRLAVAVIWQMDEPTIRLHLNRGANTAWIYVGGYLAGLRVTVEMWADDVCELQPDAKRKRDRWVLPPEVVAAVEYCNSSPS